VFPNRVAIGDLDDEALPSQPAIVPAARLLVG